MRYKHLKRLLKDSLSEIKSIYQNKTNVDLIYNLHHKNQGVTFNLKSGLVSGNLYAVSPYIMRSVKLNRLDKRDIYNFIKNNLDLLKKENHHVGTWFDPKTNEHFLDVTITTPDKNYAIKIGKAANQRSIYDMGKNEVIYIGGTGEASYMNKAWDYKPIVETSKNNFLNTPKTAKESLVKNNEINYIKGISPFLERILSLDINKNGEENINYIKGISPFLERILTSEINKDDKNTKGKLKWKN